MNTHAALINNVTLIDGVNSVQTHNAAILIEGDRIAAAGPAGSFPIPENVEVIDLPGKWVLPGLIDLHIHMSAPSVLEGDAHLESDAYAALRAARLLNENLRAGVTTIRDVGTQGRVSFDLRRAVQEGLVQGSRVFACGNAISQTGGHGADIPGLGLEADSPAGVRLAVRQMWKAGADLIKVMLNGGRNVVEYTPEELGAVVDEAHRLQLRVACHASILPAARQAVAAGVDTIEHGCHLDEDCIKAMADQDITLVATATVYEELLRLGRAGKTSPVMRDAVEVRITTHRRSVELALKHGVRIASGTDMCIPYTTLAPLPDELATLVAWGLTPLQAIQAATRNAAQALGKDGLFGAIEPGKTADLVVLEQDPLENIGALKYINRVMQAGKWFTPA